MTQMQQWQREMLRHFPKCDPSYPIRALLLQWTEQAGKEIPIAITKLSALQVHFLLCVAGITDLLSHLNPIEQAEIELILTSWNAL